jgi:hypothetical protein
LVTICARIMSPLGPAPLLQFLMPPPPVPFISPERRAALHRIVCLRETPPPAASDFARFIAAVEASIAAYVENRSKRLPFRIRHDLLRRLWHMLDEPPVSIALIRLEAGRLPKPVLAAIKRRARRVWPGFRVGAFPDGGLRAWIRTAPAEQLIPALRLLIAEGALLVVGRSRGGGVRDPSRIEPVIMGVSRGSRAETAPAEDCIPTSPRGGRIAATAETDLVMHLAIDYLNLTGKPGSFTREDKRIIGRIVAYLFDELKIKNAPWVLRRYWDAVRLTRSC